GRAHAFDPRFDGRGGGGGVLGCCRHGPLCRARRRALRNDRLGAGRSAFLPPLRQRAVLESPTAFRAQGLTRHEAVRFEQWAGSQVASGSNGAPVERSRSSAWAWKRSIGDCSRIFAAAEASAEHSASPPSPLVGANSFEDRSRRLDSRIAVSSSTRAS